jgi:hypothetical protein
MARIHGQRIWLDGRMIPWDEARVHVLTHTLHYGCGAFEGVRAYKTASGTGTITCDNGQKASAALGITGGGLTFGTTKVVNGRGTFSEVESINELFGNYAVAEAHAGVGPSSDAQALTKGNVSLALKGTGQGVNLGFDFGKFTISRPTSKKK